MKCEEYLRCTSVGQTPNSKYSGVPSTWYSQLRKRSSDDLWRDFLNIITFYYRLLLFANSPKNRNPVYIKPYAPVANARLVNHRK